MKKTGIVSLVMSCVMSMSLFSFVSAGSVLADGEPTHKSGPWEGQYDGEGITWEKEADSDWYGKEYHSCYYRELNEDSLKNICHGQLPTERAQEPITKNNTYYYLTSDIHITVASEEIAQSFSNHYYYLNGYNIYYDVEGSGYLFYAENGNRFNVSDNTNQTNTGKIISTHNAPIGYLNGNSNFDIRVPIVGSASSYSESGSSAFKILYGTLYLYSEISGFSAKQGGAIYIESGYAYINGTISNCYADEGGAIYCTGGTVYLQNGATITGNQAISRGGGLCLNGDGLNSTLNCYTCTVTGNTCVNYGEGEGGGGIFCYPSTLNSSAVVSMGETVVIDNNSNGDGDKTNLYFDGNNYRDQILLSYFNATGSHVGLSRKPAPEGEDWYYKIVTCTSTDTITDDVFFDDSSSCYLVTDSNKKGLYYYNSAYPHFLGYSVLVDGAVGFKMYFELPDSYFTGSNKYFIHNNSDQVIIKTFSDDEFIPVEGQPNRYYATAYIPPMILVNASYNLKINYQDSSKTDTTISLANYRAAIQSSGTEKDKAMVDAVVDYCYGVAAIKYGYDANTMFSYTRPYDTEDIDEPDPIVSYGPFAYKGSSLVANSETKLKHYFTIEDGSDVSKVSVYVDGVKMKLYNAGNGYYNVTITNINFFQAGTSKTVVVKYDGVDQYSFSYSPCDYLYKAVAAGDGKDNKGTYIFAKAFYNLYKTMIDYNTPNE